MFAFKPLQVFNKFVIKFLKLNFNTCPRILPVVKGGIEGNGNKLIKVRHSAVKQQLLRN